MKFAAFLWLVCLSLSLVLQANPVQNNPQLQPYSLNFYQALADCNFQKKQLLTLPTPKENENFAKESLYPHRISRVWVAAKDSARDGHYQWLTTGEYAADNFADGEPKAWSCLVLNGKDGKWYSAKCNEYQRYFCQKRSGRTN